MSDRSAAELELDAELARARVADTAESIRSKMSPGQLIDEFSGLFSGSDGVSALTSLKGQVSQNPLAVSLVGAGLAWLMLGNNSGSKQPPISDAQNNAAKRRMSATDFYSDHNDSRPIDYGSVEGKSIGDRVAEAGDTVSSLADSAVGAVKDAFESSKDQLRGVSDTATARVSSVVDSSTVKSARDMIPQEPLVLAALGLAIGTAIGAMLPGTAIEDEQLGKARDTLRDRAKGVLDKGVAEAKDVAAGAYQSIKDAADTESVEGEGGSLVNKVSSVLKTAARETEEAVREKLPNPE